VTTKARPRLAKLAYVRRYTDAVVLVARITEGPQGEVGKTVHIALRVEGITRLALVLFAAGADGNAGGKLKREDDSKT
jgi:hypothetical protein